MKSRELPDLTNRPVPAIGRFAPSPSGALHFGSLLAATASYLDACHQGGRWLLRMDDIDTPRVMPGSIDVILHSLTSHGFEWYGDIIYQSARHDLYQQALSQLIDTGLVYACDCSRAQLAQRQGGHYSGHYDGYCRQRQLPLDAPHVSLRLQVPDGLWQFDDLILGQQQGYWSQTGDFILHRRDGIMAYHLVCACDDGLLGITEVIRGADLLQSTPPQRYIQQLLNLPSPRYGHHALALDEVSGIKLSKASSAPALADEQASHNLYLALRFLQQSPPDELAHWSLADIWTWAIRHWQRPGSAPPF